MPDAKGGSGTFCCFRIQGQCCNHVQSKPSSTRVWQLVMIAKPPLTCLDLWVPIVARRGHSMPTAGLLEIGRRWRCVPMEQACTSADHGKNDTCRACCRMSSTKESTALLPTVHLACGNSPDSSRRTDPSTAQNQHRGE